nr:hypothetical protein [Candidatus Levybacteria bacterium]
MSEGQPVPSSETSRNPETEAREAVTPTIAHIAFGAVKTELLKPEQIQVTTEQKATLQALTPDKLQPMIDAGNAVSMDSRNAVEQMENKDWNVAVWNSLQSFTSESVATPLREERLRALAALDIKLDVDAKDANGLN